MDGPGSDGVNTHGNSWPSPSRITHGRTPWSRPGFGTGGTSTSLASPLNSKYSNAFQGRGGYHGSDGIMNIDGHNSTSNKMARPQSAPMLHGRLRPGQSGLVGSHAAQSMDERGFAQLGKVDGGSPVRIAGGGHLTTPVHGGGGGLRSKPRVRPSSAVERRRQGQKNNASPMLAGRDSRDRGRGRGESRGKSAGNSRVHVDAVGSPPRGYSFTANGILAMQEDGHSSTTRSSGGSGVIRSPPRSARSKNTMVGGGKRRSRQLSLKAYGVQQTPQTLTFGEGGMMSVGGSGAGGGTWTRGNKGGREGRQKTLVQAPEDV
jgi:hypothetical protein